MEVCSLSLGHLLRGRSLRLNATHRTGWRAELEVRHVAVLGHLELCGPLRHLEHGVASPRKVKMAERVAGCARAVRPSSRAVSELWLQSNCRRVSIAPSRKAISSTIGGTDK